jgi:hypothetical protein
LKINNLELPAGLKTTLKKLALSLVLAIAGYWIAFENLYWWYGFADSAAQITAGITFLTTLAITSNLKSLVWKTIIGAVNCSYGFLRE